MKIGRILIGVVGGIVLAGSVIFLAESAGHALLDGDAVFGAVAVGHGLGTAAGSFLACRLAGRRASMAVPVALGLLALTNILSFVHPWWFGPVAGLLLIAGWFVGVAPTAPRATVVSSASPRRSR